ncbi:type II toxin-antitoxin system RelE/ParE family toxin [Scandinavium sp.]|uniref:type II toxin-antitoxin system RelE/ParE family toxin n=1 Tax=Scandinavium sp. TaxID=2830653 RepID=UPI0028977405|nr:type II toxin-antitoxin system RelE/ParE family toxin [Scandinavium sp.]
MYKLSYRAAEDFGTVYEYTFRQFGPQQADSYTNQLDAILTLLAKNPHMGRDVSEIVEGIRRHEHSHHAIFYQTMDDGIFIIRILHQKMNPHLHLL